MSGAIECVLRYRDAGKICKDKRDCTGDCLFAGTDAPAPGTAATGKCQRTSDSCGCAARVNGGKVGAVMCID